MEQRLEEEKLLELEWRARARMGEIEVEKDREVAMRHLRQELMAREKEDELEEKMLAEAWRLEDEERRLQATVRLPTRRAVVKFGVLCPKAFGVYARAP